jgi:hypothetical protein
MSLRDKTHGPRRIKPCTKREILPFLIPGKLFMKKINLMTTVTTVVAVAVLSQIRDVGAFSPAGLHLRERLHSGAGKLFRRLRRMINDRVAGAIAYRERRVTQFALRNLRDADSSDFDVARGSPGSAFHRYRNVKFTTRR